MSTIPRNGPGVWRADLEPNISAEIENEAWQFYGEIILIVGEGELDIAGRGYKVDIGDFIHFDTSLPDRWHAS